MEQMKLMVSTQVRLPVPLAEKVRDSAACNRRSFNKEVQFLLERALEKKEAAQPAS
ncbi:MAG: Arc family DNA-binding protein [Burkholderiaceae bacterium]|nr:Arc family DNA-binding protein [Burkholderiaceae bacterium]